MQLDTADDRGGRPARRSNEDRTRATRAALLAAGRRLFVAKGFAETSTPEIVEAAAVTRGALYHHFREKRDLFRAVVEAEAQAVAEAVEQSAPARLPPREALVAGARAYLAAMAVAGRTRLLLIDGPAVLGADAMQALDEACSARTLREGLTAAMTGAPPAEQLPVTILTALLSAAFDRAALLIAGGADAGAVETTMIALISRMVPAAP